MGTLVEATCQVGLQSGSQQLWAMTPSPSQPTWEKNHLSLAWRHFLGLLTAHQLACPNLGRYILLWKLRVCCKLGTQTHIHTPQHNYKYWNPLQNGVFSPCPAVLPKSATDFCANLILHVSQNSLHVHLWWPISFGFVFYFFSFHFSERSGTHEIHRQWRIPLLCH